MQCVLEVAQIWGGCEFLEVVGGEASHTSSPGDQSPPGLVTGLAMGPTLLSTPTLPQVGPVSSCSLFPPRPRTSPSYLFFFLRRQPGLGAGVVAATPVSQPALSSRLGPAGGEGGQALLLLPRQSHRHLPPFPPHFSGSGLTVSVRPSRPQRPAGGTKLL